MAACSGGSVAAMLRGDVPQNVRAKIEKLRGGKYQSLLDTLLKKREAAQTDDERERVDKLILSLDKSSGGYFFGALAVLAIRRAGPQSALVDQRGALDMDDLFGAGGQHAFRFIDDLGDQSMAAAVQVAQLQAGLRLTIEHQPIGMAGQQRRLAAQFHPQVAGNVGMGGVRARGKDGQVPIGRALLRAHQVGCRGGRCGCGQRGHPVDGTRGQRLCAIVGRAVAEYQGAAGVAIAVHLGQGDPGQQGQ